MDSQNQKRQPYALPLTILLWLLVALLLLDFIGRFIVVYVIAATGIFDKFLLMLGL